MSATQRKRMTASEFPRPRRVLLALCHPQPQVTWETDLWADGLAWVRDSDRSVWWVLSKDSNHGIVDQVAVRPDRRRPWITFEFGTVGSYAGRIEAGSKIYSSIIIL